LKLIGGIFCISLDFEKFWGIHDVSKWQDQAEKLKRVENVVYDLLDLFEKYNIHVSWATIGLLNYSNLEELIRANSDKQIPYKKSEYSPFPINNIQIEKIEIPDLKNAKKLSIDQIKTEEGKLILKKLEPNGLIVLMDEKGREFSSLNFADWLQNSMNRSYKHITFVIGGGYGFSDDIYQLVPEKMSISRMTFSHQMVRMFFLEQIYRAFSILNKDPYHNQ